jgi:histidine triad (HIT) family protein
VRGQIPSARLLETDEVVAFLDIHPVNPGHLLIVPKVHCADLSELPEAVAAHAGSLLPRLCRAIQAATGADGLNVIVNNGRAAGQTIDHCHWHIIPRFHDDPVSWPWPQGEYVGDELGQMTFRIERELNSNPESNHNDH